MTESGKCVFDCGRTIDPELDYRKVTGYERRRHAGGTNALRMREPHDVWACRFCIDKQAKGLDPGQGSLI